MTMRTGSGQRFGRRRLLAGGGLAVGGALAATGGLLAGCDEQSSTPTADGPDVGGAVVPFHGAHQAGVITPPQANGVFLAMDLRKGVDRSTLAKMMRLLSDDAARLTAGRSALADTEPELAVLPSSLTVTFGFGPGLFAAAGLPQQRPESVAALPSFDIDRLEQRWSGGDLLIQICADDPVTVAHAQRMLVKDARSFATVRWRQRGFRRAVGVEDPQTTQRNLMGQVDGTVQPSEAVWDRAVWVHDGPQWLHGGTTMVVRRIREELETWDRVDRAGKEMTIGRRLEDGAPLTGGGEKDPVDFDAVDGLGLPVISEFAHVRRARVADEAARILRRPYNYDDGVNSEGVPDTGLLFVSFQADVARQFLPIQRRLAEADLLNEWTTPVGSAVFAIPPGCDEGGWIGQTLLG